ncbi:MAG: SUMF1/EgtB/PvdO family nonheme iron enzyme [Polyangiaceae bacterium]
MRWATFSLASGSLSLACGTSGKQVLAPPDAIPAKVTVAGGIMHNGAALEAIRSTSTLASYSISRTPTTVKQYGQCVSAGACSPPSVKDGPCKGFGANAGATFGQKKAAQDQPVTCVTSDDANKYCSWVGGRLPTSSEWLLAARGPEVQRFAWGLTPATCAQRADHVPMLDCCGEACESEVATAVGRHSAGNSPSGMSDVLLAPSELIAGDTSSPEPACSPPARSCIVAGMQPGGIDTFMVAPKAEHNSTITRFFATSFRCAWEGAAQ